jgi:hypothetical protein
VRSPGISPRIAFRAAHLFISSTTFACPAITIGRMFSDTFAGLLGRAVATVRGWLRRFAARAEAVRSAFTVLVCELDADPLLPGPSGSAAADAVAAAVAAARRWGELASALSPWKLASAVTSGVLLSPRRCR